MVATLCLRQTPINMSSSDCGNDFYDCVVVGAGVEGSSTAYQLAKNGKKTLLLEQFPLGHGRGSSCGHSRITRYAYPEQHFAQMMPECFKMWAQLEAESKTTLYKKCGLLVTDEPPYKQIGSIQQCLDSLDCKYTILEGPEINRSYPGLSMPEDTRGIMEHTGGVLLADKCLRALQTQFQQEGGTIHDAETVLKIDPGETVNITTNRGQYAARSVVLAPGSWASKLLKTLDLEPPLRPWVVDVCYWKEKTAGQFDNFPCLIVYNNTHVYALPSIEYPGLIKLCAHEKPIASTVDPDRRDILCPEQIEHMKQLERFVANFVPGVEDKPAIVEKCLYTYTPDESPFIDTHPRFKNVVIGCGFSGHGFKLAPVVGKLLSELATGTEPSYDLTPFQLARFPNGPQAEA